MRLGRSAILKALRTIQKDPVALVALIILMIKMIRVAGHATAAATL